MELIIEGSERRFRRNLGNAIVERSGDSITTRYVYTDHLGSVDVITNAIGQLIEKLSFDAFGKRRAVFTSSGQSIALNLSTLLAITHQGFTGHQQVDHAGIVQMGGRIYDSHIGRFLQADPFVQSPSNSQNFNRYSYVLNNPLSYTDPSGYLFNPLKKVGRNIIRGAVKVFGADVVNFVGSAVSMFYGGAWGAAAWSYEFNRAMGASSSAAFKSAAIAGASAFAFSQIGSYYQGLSEAGTGTINFGGNMLTAGQVAGQITAHAMVGGVAASLQGGKFGHGFFSAGVTKGLGGAFLPGGSELSASEVVYGTVVSAMIGGTASVVAGGKFANGARTASMQYLMNQAANEKSGLGKWVRERVSGFRALFTSDRSAYRDPLPGEAAWNNACRNNPIFQSCLAGIDMLEEFTSMDNVQLPAKSGLVLEGAREFGKHTWCMQNAMCNVADVPMGNIIIVPTFDDPTWLREQNHRASGGKPNSEWWKK